MAGNRQKKSSSGLLSIFNIFSSKKPRGNYYDVPDSGRMRVWHSDDDKGNWGVADPNINKKAEDFIRKYKKHVSESARYQLDPAAEDA